MTNISTDLKKSFSIKRIIYEVKIMCCENCVYRHSWDCDDGYNRRSNCSSFKLDWDTLTDFEKKLIQSALESKTENNNGW